MIVGRDPQAKPRGLRRQGVTVVQCGQQIDPGIAPESLRDGENFRGRKGVEARLAMIKTRRPSSLRRDPQDGGAIPDQGAIGCFRPIPFEHGEFGVMCFRPLAIAKDMGEGKNPLLAGRQQFLAVEFRRAMQEIRRGRAAQGTKLGGETGDMGLVARRYLQG